MLTEVILLSGNAWLIIGLILCILELSNGSLIFFLPMGISALIVGLILKLQESGNLSVLMSDWAWTATVWALLSLVLSLLLNRLMRRKKDDTADIIQY